MNRWRAGLTVAWYVAVLVACTREPGTPKPKIPCSDGKSGPLDCRRDDNLDGPRPTTVTSSLEAACAGIDRAGCPEAHPKTGTCAEFLAVYEADHITVKAECFAAAQTPADVRSCGGPGLATVRCQTPATGR